MKFSFSPYLVVSENVWSNSRGEKTLTISGTTLFNVDTLTPVIAGGKCVAYAKITRVMYSSSSTTIEFDRVKIDPDTAKAIYNLYRNQNGGKSAVDSGDYSAAAPIGSYQSKSKSKFNEPDDDDTFNGRRRRFDI